MSRVVLAMSGGVDSSVAAHLLVEQGHDVIGVFMRHGEQSPAACEQQRARGGSVAEPCSLGSPHRHPLHHKQGCCTAADAEDARRVADKLGIPFYALNLQQEFGQIIDYFVAEYTAGRTPNPCVQCNNWIKFGKLFDYADSVGAEFVATGHYARLETQADGAVALLRGVDAAKDQSYVLFGIRRELLPRMMLPVGELREAGDPPDRGRASACASPTRRTARKSASSPAAATTSSSAAATHADTAGELVTTDGTVVGEHDGIESFTVGQRKGLGVALGERKFVVRIEPDTHRVVIGDRARTRPPRTDGPRLQLARRPIAKTQREPRRCYAQIRYNAAGPTGHDDAAAGTSFAHRIRRTAVRRHAGPGRRLLRRREQSSASWAAAGSSEEFRCRCDSRCRRRSKLILTS